MSVGLSRLSIHPLGRFQRSLSELARYGSRNHVGLERLRVLSHAAQKPTMYVRTMASELEGKPIDPRHVVQLIGPPTGILELLGKGRLGAACKRSRSQDPRRWLKSFHLRIFK